MKHRYDSRTRAHLATLAALVLAGAACSTHASPSGRVSPDPPTPQSATASASPGPAGQILFTRFNAQGVVGAFLVEADGTGERPVRAGTYYAPRVSPDGTQVLVGAETADQRITTAIMKLDGTGYRELEVDDGLNLACRAWSLPDGQRCAAEGWDDHDPNRSGVYTLSTADGHDVRRVTTSPPGYHDIPGAYTPDGRQIIFARSGLDTGASTLHIVNADGSGERQVADGEFGLETSLTADGASILAYAGGMLYAVPLDGSSPRQPVAASADLAGSAFGVVASPDGEWLAFSMLPPGQRADIFVMRLDGSALRRVTNTPGEDDEVSDWVH